MRTKRHSTSRFTFTRHDKGFVERALKKYGIEIVRDDGDEIAALCPFHPNKSSPAFYISKTTGLWLCFNPSCGKKGSLSSLAREFGEELNHKPKITIEDIDALFEPEREDEEDWMGAIERVATDWSNPESVANIKYLIDRGFRTDVLRHFEVGFSKKMGRIVIPARDENFKLVGFIGRSPDPDEYVRYKYSRKFPRKDILWNLQNAKNFSEVIVVEGSLDAMMVHQAGYPNVVATLGAVVTDGHKELLSRHFSKIILFGDADDPGQAMNRSVIDALPRKDIYVVTYKDPDAFSDPGSMPEDVIRSHVKGAIDYLSFIISSL